MMHRSRIIDGTLSTAAAAATRATFRIGLHGWFASICQIDFEAFWFRVVIAGHNRFDIVEIVVQAWRNRLGCLRSSRTATAASTTAWSIAGLRRAFCGNLGVSQKRCVSWGLCVSQERGATKVRLFIIGGSRHFIAPANIVHDSGWFLPTVQVTAWNVRKHRLQSGIGIWVGRFLKDLQASFGFAVTSWFAGWFTLAAWFIEA
jgi:hypothetical protein